METQGGSNGNDDENKKKGFWVSATGAVMELKEQLNQRKIIDLISEYNRGGFDEQKRQRLLSQLNDLGVSSTDERLR